MTKRYATIPIEEALFEKIQKETPEGAYPTDYALYILCKHFNHTYIDPLTSALQQLDKTKEQDSQHPSEYGMTYREAAYYYDDKELKAIQRNKDRELYSNRLKEMEENGIELLRYDENT